VCLLPYGVMPKAQRIRLLARHPRRGAGGRDADLPAPGDQRLAGRLPGRRQRPLAAHPPGPPPGHPGGPGDRPLSDRGRGRAARLGVLSAPFRSRDVPPRSHGRESSFMPKERPRTKELTAWPVWTCPHPPPPMTRTVRHLLRAVVARRPVASRPPSVLPSGLAPSPDLG
jgi:hypothetical protein